MTLYKNAENQLKTTICDLYGGVDVSRIVVEPPRDPSHGDMATNAAMILSGQLKQKPRDIAEEIAEKITQGGLFLSADIAGPGFINFTVKTESFAKEESF